MGTREHQRREDYQNAVEALCTDLAALNARVKCRLWRPTIETVMSTAPLTDPWYAAVRGLHEMAVAAGVPGGLGLTTPMGRPGWPGGDGAAPRRVCGWVCPKRVCTRVELAGGEAGESKPDTDCHLLGLAMHFVEG
ncbi:MAG TPA: hypothetical protein VGS97_23755 [Actinocrinis sp.]|uniref:hypothetical protein n=1 Tax=Actinocrinis sp. TaxID=1920516 RepID=UPI002DDCB1AF|nr:hypothetical protein [Actinocrinis sp.]HEV2347135.1 hypothetical protein [Actinocrinis sp.]